MHIRIEFLKRCMKSNIILSHLNRCKGYDKNLHNNISAKKFEIILKRFVKSMMRNEIYDAHD